MLSETRIGLSSEAIAHNIRFGCIWVGWSEKFNTLLCCREHLDTETSLFCEIETDSDRSIRMEEDFWCSFSRTLKFIDRLAVMESVSHSNIYLSNYGHGKMSLVIGSYSWKGVYRVFLSGGPNMWSRLKNTLIYQFNTCD